MSINSGNSATATPAPAASGWDSQAHAPALSRPRLPALTSLRFFAAFLIVFHHINGIIFPYSKTLHRWNLQEGVTFFFVLSGVILTYVYPELRAGARLRFLWAHIARIWPAHLFALALLLYLIYWQSLAGHHRPWVFVANIFLLQAWFPYYHVFFSFNAVSWTISVEMLFYVLFPFLVWKLAQTWHVKLIAAFGLMALMCYLASARGLPYFSAAHGVISQTALTTINPLSRVFQFVFGMMVALAWRNYGHRFTLGRISTTVAEVLAVALCTWTVYHANVPAAWHAGVNSTLSFGQLLWLRQGAFDYVPFGILIFLLATERGLISLLLSFSPLVVLGEISYSMYLLHQVVLRWYVLRMQAFTLVPHVLILPFYLALVLALSYVSFAFIETPARYGLTRLFPKKSVARPPATPPPVPAGESPKPTMHVLRARWESFMHSKAPWKIGLPVAGFGLLVAPVIYFARLPEVAWITQATAAKLQQGSLPQSMWRPMGPNLTLLAARVHPAGPYAYLTLVWHNNAFIHLNHEVVVRLLTAGGKVRKSFHFRQEDSRLAALPNSYWFNRTRLRERWLKPSTQLQLVLLKNLHEKLAGAPTVTIPLNLK